MVKYCRKIFSCKKVHTLFAICYLLFAFSLSSCSPEYKFKRIKRLENKGLYIPAAEKYIKFSAQYRGHSLAPEALYNAGKIYHKLQLYNESIKIFSEILRLYPQEHYWGKLAQRGIFNSPDYFPLGDGNIWVEGDSETGGKNMLVEIHSSSITSDTFRFVSTYYAGKKLVTQKIKYYTKYGYELRESTLPDMKTYTVVVSYPFTKGKSFTTTIENHQMRFTIIDTDVTVKVRTGEFKNCIKMMIEDLSLPAAVKYNYYAPNVGKVLTATGRKGSLREYRNSELVSYKILTKQ